MALYCLAILLGAYALELPSQLPAAGLLLPCGLLATALLVFRRTRLAGAFFCGFSVMWLAAMTCLDDRLDASLAGQDTVVVGSIEDFPSESEGLLRFMFAPTNRPDLPKKIRLAWYEPAYSPSVGETWHLQVRLQRPRGLANPDGFDFDGWLFRQGIGATGYVIEPGDNRRVISLRPGMTSRVRQRFVDRVSKLLPSDSAAAVLIAIGVGARHKITRPDWDEYAATGTSHLMAISGLHIGLAASSFFWLGWVFLAPVCRRVNVRDLATILAIVAAGLYAEVSGFAVPARRAFLMALMLAIALALRRRFDNVSVLGISCLLIFLNDPLSILTPGFRMSFAAVAVLHIGASTFARQETVFDSKTLAHACSHTRRLFCLQLALLSGLFPLSVLLFDRFAVSAPLVNMLVLPVFNFVTVPFCLFGMLLDGPLQVAGDVLLRCSHQSIKLVLALVADVAAEPGLRFEVAALSALMTGVACVPLLYILLPSGWPGRNIAVLAIVAVVSYRPPAPPPGCLDYTVLDVGQGLAAVLQTNGHTLLFDTGPAYRSGNDVAQLAVLPFLRRRGIGNVDKLIVSHADLDHAGGVQSLIAEMNITEILAGEKVHTPSLTALPCRAGAEWDWDGIRFAILHPRNRSAWDGNNLSCVLLVSVANHEVLFTGDIESPVEMLLAYRAVLPPVSVVLIPHHGSRTSSSNAMVTALRPDLAIVSAGFANRWGMPKDEVVQRWQRAGAEVVNTATSGAISQRLCAGRAAGPVARARIDSLRYWQDTSSDSR